MHHSWAIDPNADRAYRNFETPQKCVRRNPPTAGSFHPSAKKGAKCMFTRIVELTTKPGKNKQLADTIDEKVLPILRKQKGFVDEMVLLPDKENNRILGLSFWNSKEDAEQYHREQYPKVRETLEHLLESEPVIRTFD